MRRSLLRASALVSLCGFLLGGCVTTPQIKSEKRAQGVSASSGVVLVTFERAKELNKGDWGIGIRELAEGTPGEAVPFKRRGAAASYSNIVWRGRGWTGPEDAPVAYELVPGRYGLTDIGPRYRNQSIYVQNMGGGGGAAALVAIGIIAIAGVAAVATEDDRIAALRANRPPLLFMIEREFIPETPTFEIKAGEVVYIGHFKLGAKFYEFERVRAKQTDPGSSPEEEIVTGEQVAAFIEYETDEARGRAAAETLGLSSRPLRTVHLGLPAGDIFVSPDASRENIEAHVLKITGERVVRAP